MACLDTNVVSDLRKSKPLNAPNSSFSSLLSLARRLFLPTVLWQKLHNGMSN